MAKRKINKSEEVRKYMAAHPDAGPSAVAEALKKYKVTPNYVSNIKLKMGGAKKRRGRKARATASTSQADVSSMRAAAAFIKSCGSIEAARDAFRAAEQIASVLK